jgi:hypothetical protein
MARKSRAARRSASSQGNIVVLASKGKASRSRSRSRRRSVGFTPVNTPRNGSVVSTGLFRPSRDFEKPTLGGAILNPRFGARRSRGRRAMGSGAGSLPHLVATYVDPFDEEAGGCRYPDVFQGITDTFTTTYVNSIMTVPATGASFTDLNMAQATPLQGTSLFLLTPDPSNIMVQGVCGTGTAGVFNNTNNIFFWPNGQVFDFTTNTLNAFGPGTGVQGIDNVIGNIVPFRVNYNAARLVSGGVKLFSTQNFSTVSGTIHIAPVFVNFSKFTSNNNTLFGGGRVNQVTSEVSNGWQTALPSNLQTMSNLPGYAQFPMSALEEDEIAAIFKRAGEEALLFKPTSQTWCMDDGDAQNTALRTGNANTPDSYGHYCILVFVDGVQSQSGSPAAPLSPIMSIQIRNHYECQINPSAVVDVGSTTVAGGYSPDAHKSAPHQPLLLAAANNLASDVPVVRCVDAAGVEELGFIEAVAGAWKSAIAIAGSVAGAVDVAGTLLSALVL